MRKLLILASVAMCLQSCQAIKHPVPFGLYRGMQDKAPDGPEEFRHGWRDGCESGLAAYGPLHYKVTYDYKYDVNMIENNEYYSAWSLGFRHCRWYIAEWARR